MSVFHVESIGRAEEPSNYGEKMVFHREETISQPFGGTMVSKVQANPHQWWEEVETMRSIQTLGFTCIAALSCTATAENAEPVPYQMTARTVGSHTVSTSWQSGAAETTRYDRLRYLNGSLCVERAGCTTSAAASQPARALDDFDYIDSLDLGTYGPMNFKFTGDRVKLKVRF